MLSFAGDAHFEGRLRSLLDQPDQALKDLAPLLSASDLTVVNLETSIGSGGMREPKRFTFQAPPVALAALAAAGVDVVTMANNHSGDFGVEGLAESLDAADRAARAVPRLDVVGIGAKAQSAFAPAVREVRGTTVAVFGASAADADPTADRTGHWAAGPRRAGVAMALDPTRLLSAVRAVQATADVIVVYLHWGVQGQMCPSSSQRDLAQELSAAGADIVVGSHAHRLQGAGMLGETYVAYGLGNFIWYSNRGESARTGLLSLEVDDGRVVREAWSPANIGSSGLPSLLTGDHARAATDAFWRLRECASLKPVKTSPG